MADPAARIRTAVTAPGILRRRTDGLTRFGGPPGRAWAVARFSLDTAMLLTAGVATTLGASAAGVPAPPAIWLAVFTAFTLAVSAVRGLYASRLRYELLEDLRSVVIATSLAAMGVLTLRARRAPGRSLGPDDPHTGPSQPPMWPWPCRLALVPRAVLPPRRVRPADAHHRRWERGPAGCEAAARIPSSV